MQVESNLKIWCVKKHTCPTFAGYIARVHTTFAKEFQKSNVQICPFVSMSKEINNNIKSNCHLRSSYRSPTWHDDSCIFQDEIGSCLVRFQFNMKEKDAP